MNIEKVKGYFIQNSIRIKSVTIATYLTALLSYYIFIINGYTNADGLTEGLRYYFHSEWALANGRWAVRYFNFVFGNYFVFPLIVIFLYATFIIIIALVIGNLLRMESTLALVMSSAILMVSSPVIAQLAFANIAVAYAGAFFFAIIYLVCILSRNKWVNIFAPISLAISLGLYQSYVSAAAFMLIATVVVKLIDQEDIRATLKVLVKGAISGVLGCILNVIIYRLECYFRNVEISGRVSSFHLKGIFEDLFENIANSYRIVINYFMDLQLHRYVLFTVFIAIILICATGIVLSFVKKEDYLRLVLIFGLTICLPIVANLISIIVPGYDLRLIMQHQYALFVPLGLAIIERGELGGRGLRLNYFFKGSALLTLGIIISTYVLSANATCLSYEYSYKSLHTQFQSITDDILALDGYEINSTPILMIGFPKENRSPMSYDLAIDMTDRVACWEFENQVFNSTNLYMIEYMGIYSDYIKRSQYESVVSTGEYKNMPLWPKRGSVRMINNIAVVKISEDGQ